MLNLNQNEKWKSIEGYNDEYLISNYGRIKSLKRKKAIIMKQQIDKDGYHTVVLWCNITKKKIYNMVHRLVASAFIKNRKPDVKTTVNHLNSNKQDNYYKNLAWTTPKENFQHAVKNGLIVRPKGENHPCSKLTKKDVSLIRAKYTTGEYTLKRLADQNSVSAVTIFNIIRYNTWC